MKSFAGNILSGSRKNNLSQKDWKISRSIRSIYNTPHINVEIDSVLHKMCSKHYVAFKSIIRSFGHLYE